MYQVLARKWRPPTFDELVGQQHVARTLSNALESDRLAHAFIFAGLRGTGKTTVARILAKCLNCETGPTVRPCGKCDACIEIAESRAMDVLELDAASRTGVNDVRELQEVIAYAPARDRYKVLIIDEAHMLTKNAFNALLKTLEEPPPRVVFILATTEIQKLLPTILSRCQVFEFRRVGVRELADHLRRICDAEEIKISDSSLERVARAGEGSVRDSLSVLERVLAFCGQEVDDEDVLRMLGGVRFEVLSRMVTAVAARDAGAMLQILDGLVDEGHDLLHFWTELIGVLRDLLLLRAVPERDDLLTRSPDEARSLAASAVALSVEDLTRTFQVLADLEPALKASSQPRFMFESALFRISSLAAVVPIEDLLGAIQEGTPPAPTAPGGPAPARSPTSSPPPRSSRSKRSSSADAVRGATAAAPAGTPAAADPARPGGGLRQDFESAVLSEKTMLGTIIEGAAAIEAGDGRLILSFEPGMEAMARQLKRSENLAVLKRQATRLQGAPTEIEILVASVAEQATLTETAPAPARESDPESIDREESAGGLQDNGSSDEETDGGNAGSLIELAKSEPGVRKLLREFGAQVVDIQPSDPLTPTPAPTADPGKLEESP